MVRIGSDGHKEEFCRDFIDSHLRFEPEELPWPELDDAALARMRAVPFWQEVLHTERRAGRIVAAFAETIRDPLVREAIDLQGIEEERHARLLAVMSRRYGLGAEERQLEPLADDLYTGFVDFGYGECLNSFLGFGVFKIARESRFLPEPLFRIFDTLMLEETRHIVFFMNWMAWQAALRGNGGRARLAAISTRYYARALGRLIGTIRRGRKENDGKDFWRRRPGSSSTALRSAGLSRRATPKTLAAWPPSSPDCCALACCRRSPGRRCPAAACSPGGRPSRRDPPRPPKQQRCHAGRCLKVILGPPHVRNSKEGVRAGRSSTESRRTLSEHGSTIVQALGLKRAGSGRHR